MARGRAFLGPDGERGASQFFLLLAFACCGGQGQTNHCRRVNTFYRPMISEVHGLILGAVIHLDGLRLYVVKAYYKVGILQLSCLLAW